MKIVLVELANGDQEYFESTRDALLFAKEKEAQEKNSVDLVAMTTDNDLIDVTILYGQELRLMLRSVDNLTGWLKSGAREEEQQNDL